MPTSATAPRRLLVVAGVFPVDIQPFVTSHIEAMLTNGWQVAVCTRRVDQPTLARLSFRDRLSSVQDLESAAAKLSRARRMRLGWNLLMRFGAGYYRRFPQERSKKLSAQACALFDFAREYRPVAIHAHFGSTGQLAAPVADRLGIPLLVSFHGEEICHYHEAGLGPVYSGRLGHATVVVHSEFMRQWTIPKVSGPVVRVPFAVDATQFAARPAPKAWGSPLQLLVIGRLVPYKGQVVALRALRRLLDAGVAAHLTLIGDGNARPACEATINELNLTQHATLAGWRTQGQVAEALGNADFVLVPSVTNYDGWQETFCLVALEAMCIGVPVIASNHGALPESVGSGGVLVPEGDDAAFAATIARLRDSATPADLHRRALAQANKYPHKAMAAAYQAVTMNAIATRTGPDLLQGTGTA